MTVPAVAASIGAWLWDKYGDKLIERLRDEAKEKWSKVNWKAAAETYRNRIVEVYGSTQIFGQPRPVPLDDVFTDVYLLEEPTAFRRYDIHQLRSDPELPTSARRVSGCALVERAEAQRLFILGKPGAGKTTFLKHLAIEAAKGKLDKVPILVTLKSWTDSREDLLAFIARQFATCGFPDATHFIEHLLDKSDDALVLFDGLDEIRQEDQARARVVDELRDFARRYRRAQCLITCRIAATDYTFEQFAYVEIADLTYEQMEIFVGKWFHEVPNKGEAFLREINRDEYRGLRELARTPLLLAMLCLAFNDTLRFPTRRVEVYADALDALLRKWDSSRNIRRDEIYRDLSAGRKHQLLARIAAQTFERNSYFIAQDELEAHITSYLSRLPHSDVADSAAIDGAAVLKAIEAQHGILVERAHRIYSFAHLSFQEYYTARYIVDNAARGTLSHLLAQITDGRWREVILLAASLLDNADGFVLEFRRVIDRFALEEATLVTALRWATDTALQSDTPYSSTAVRAISFFLLLSAILLEDASHALERALALDLALALDHARDLDGYQERGIALDRAHDLDRSLHLARHIALDLDRIRDLDLALDLALNLALSLARELTRDRIRDLDRAHVRTRAFARDRDLTRDLAYELGSHLELALNRDRDRALVLDLDLDLDINFNLDLDLEFARECAHEMVRASFSAVREAVNEAEALCQFLSMDGTRQAFKNLALSKSSNLPDDPEPMLESLHGILTQHFGITYRQFGDEQLNQLRIYLAATHLLIECLNVAYVSNRQAIEDSLLLPPGMCQLEDLVRSD